MDRLIASNSVPMAQADTAPTTGTPQGATDGNAASNIPATRWPSYQYNAIQEELIAVLTAGGVTPDRTNNGQIAAAIKALRSKTSVIADTGAVNAYAAANATPLTASTWLDGVAQAVKIAHTNTGASTYAPDGLSAIPIYGLGLAALQQGELFAGGTAILMRTTIAGVNSGNPICVLMECTGGPQQVAPAAASQHAVQLGQVGHGQCRLSVSSTTTLVLKPYNGNNVIVNGVPLQLPAAGVTYTASGLTAGTGYYVYLGGTTAAPVLSLSTNAHSPASNGVETMTSNTALTLVGMVYYNSSGQFAATSNSQLCFNWFQRRRLPLATATVSTSTASGSYTATTAVVSTMGWADDYFEVAAFGAGYNSTATDGGAIQIFQNGTAGLGSTGYITSSTAGGSTAQSSLVARNTNTAPSELTLYTLTAYIVATGGGTANFAFSLHGSTGG